MKQVYQWIVELFMLCGYNQVMLALHNCILTNLEIVVKAFNSLNQKLSLDAPVYPLMKYQYFVQV